VIPTLCYHLPEGAISCGFFFFLERLAYQVTFLELLLLLLNKIAKFSRRAPRRAAVCCTPSPARANATVSLTTARGLAILVASAPLPLPFILVYPACLCAAEGRRAASSFEPLVGPAPPPSAAGTSSSTPATSCATSSAAPPAAPA